MSVYEVVNIENIQGHLSIIALIALEVNVKLPLVMYNSAVKLRITLLPAVTVKRRVGETAADWSCEHWRPSC